jgi:hypothetical protein
VEQHVTIRGFKCRSEDEPIVREIIRMVEEEQPRLGTVYTLKNRALRAAIYGPYENGTKAARGIFFRLEMTKDGLRRCRYRGHREGKRQYTCSPVNLKAGLGARFFEKLKESREAAKELLHVGDAR